MGKMYNWVKAQIEKRGGVQESSAVFYKMGSFYISIIEADHWDTPITTAIVFREKETVPSSWAITKKSDMKKTEKILDALIDPDLFRLCQEPEIKKLKGGV